MMTDVCLRHSLPRGLVHSCSVVADLPMGAERAEARTRSGQSVLMTQAAQTLAAEGALLSLALSEQNITGARMDSSIYPGTSGGAAVYISSSSPTRPSPPGYCSRSTEGLKSKSRQDT